MRQTVIIVVSLAFGFGLGYLAANIGSREDTGPVSNAAHEDKTPPPGRAQAGTSAGTDGENPTEVTDDTAAERAQPVRSNPENPGDDQLPTQEGTRVVEEGAPSGTHPAQECAD